MSENVADPDTRIEVHIIGQEASAPKKRGWWGHRRPNDMNSMIDY